MTNQSRDNTGFPVVGIGSSAGGLDACRAFLDALPADSGMAFVMIQHLDPTHQSMMADLLASHTEMQVQQATDGMPIERNSIYTIPPGAYLSIESGVLRVSEPTERHGARLPFDFLLKSLAKECGRHAICIVLSGMGRDGSLGAKAIKENEGLVIVQDPVEASFDGMPRSAIKTGVVDLVLPVAEMPGALINFDKRTEYIRKQTGVPKANSPPDWLAKVIELLRVESGHDFRLYKTNTIQRRVERRAAMKTTGTEGIERYLDILQSDADELELLAKDLLIHVTSFFRDANVFYTLEKEVIPQMIRQHDTDQPLRIWIAGCSTGEETYSLAMLFLEQIEASRRPIKLQIFASDIDEDAVASARQGVYPVSIEDEVSPERLARFFTKEDHIYRVSGNIRNTVVFAVQDLFSDPPFSRLDMVSCRNLLIYLQPKAQEKVISLFHFALKEGGLLLLGSSEAIGEENGRFEVVSKPARIFRHTSISRPGEAGFSELSGSTAPDHRWHGTEQPRSHHSALIEFCRKEVLDAFAPAAVLINRKRECLCSLGPTSRFLSIAPELRTNDLLAMVEERIRIKLKSAVDEAVKTNERVEAVGSRLDKDKATTLYKIVVQPTLLNGEALFLVYFVDGPKQVSKPASPAAGDSQTLVEDLQHELEVTRQELDEAIRDLKISGEEQRAVNEALLSVNEEYQSTNEELLTSKEEMQSLNEELTALNHQLQETLDQQRRTSNDLQNVLYSTAIATLFLDGDLNIRFFTPATKTLVNILASDVGRPLSDLKSDAIDRSLITDARKVLQDLTPVDREVEIQEGWYARRILPYRAQEDSVEGVVITFNDITERKRAAEALEEAKQEAEMANVAKSRFLAAASHDLRQPLQTLSLLHGVLARPVSKEKSEELVGLMGQTLAAMTGMLNTLLDINQIDAGVVQADMEHFKIDDLLKRMRDEFNYHAQAKGLSLHVVPCSLTIYSDRHLLEQMIRNLLQNAVKYSNRGKILLGCRRSKEMLSIQVLDTGVGIPDDELNEVFNEYHQIDNSARERSRGLGLGLSIVRRLGTLLNHRLRVNSQLGKGSTFAIEVAQAAGTTDEPKQPTAKADDRQEDLPPVLPGTILIVEDEPDVRTTLALVLQDEGHSVFEASDGIEAMDLIDRKSIRPDLLLADYNLPKEMTGLQFAVSLQEKLRRKMPVVIITGDISTTAMQEISQHDCEKLNKPVELNQLLETIQRLLRSSPPKEEPAGKPLSKTKPRSNSEDETEKAHIFVVDDDLHVRDAMRSALEGYGWTVETYSDSETFLESYRPGENTCLLVDAALPGMSGLDLLRNLKESGRDLPSVMITGKSDVPMAVNVMKAGASDFVEKPIDYDELVESIERALEQSRSVTKRSAWHEDAKQRIACLTRRQRQVMDAILSGHPNKNIAADLGISQRTVEHHRAAVLKRTGSKSLPDLARLAMAANEDAAVE